jgi:acetyl esterase/lipase
VIYTGAIGRSGRTIVDSSSVIIRVGYRTTILVTTSEDTAVPLENTLDFYQALRKAGVPAELHIFEKGNHGFGLTAAEPEHEVWHLLLEQWLRQRGLLASYELPPNPDR